MKNLESKISNGQNKSTNLEREGTSDIDESVEKEKLMENFYQKYFETKTVVRTQTPAGSRGNFRIDMMVSCLEGVIRGEQNLKKKRNLHNHVGVYRYLQDKYGLVEVEEAPNVFLERRIPANVVALFLEEGMLGKSRLYNAARQGYPELFG